MTIEYGTPATYYIGSDCYAEQIVEIHTFKTGARAGQPKTLVTRDVNVDWSLGANYGVSDQEAFSQNLEGKLSTYTVRKNGKFRPEGSDCGSLVIGTYREYRDPSF